VFHRQGPQFILCLPDVVPCAAAFVFKRPSCCNSVAFHLNCYNVICWTCAQVQRVVVGKGNHTSRACMVSTPSASNIYLPRANASRGDSTQGGGLHTSRDPDIAYAWVGRYQQMKRTRCARSPVHVSQPTADHLIHTPVHATWHRC
jgi:hypothetical protein